MLSPLLTRHLHRFYDLGLTSFGRLNSVLAPVLPLSPLILRIRVTQNCNFHCSYCYQADSLNPGEKNHLSLEEWKKVIDELPRHTALDITGGEPFIARNFAPLMEYVLAKGHKTSVITNGSVYNEDLMRFFVKHKLFYLMFSVEDVGVRHDELRDAPKSYEKILRNLRLIQELKQKTKSRYPLVAIKTTITDQNYQNLIALHEECARLGMIDFHSLNLQIQNSVRGGNTLYQAYQGEAFESGNTATHKAPPKAIADAVKGLLELSKKTRIPVSFRPDLRPDELEAYFSDPGSFGVASCSKMNGIITLYYDGSLAPCDIGLNAGNIRDYEYDVKRVWRSQRFRAFEDKLKSRFPYAPECAGCCLARHSRITKN